MPIVLTFPSVHEFGGAVVLEAMAAGVVPVVVNYGGPAELVSPASGYLLPLGDRAALIASLRATLEAILADPAQLAARSRARGVDAGIRPIRLAGQGTADASRCIAGCWASGADKPDMGLPFLDPAGTRDRAAVPEAELTGMRFVVSLAEQGFGSILTFAINLWLIRNGATESYGVYVFWLSVAWVLGTAQGTLVIAHLYRLPSARDRMEERRQPERLLLSLAFGISVLAAAGVGVLVDWLLTLSGSELASPGAVLFIPAFLLFQYVRAFSVLAPAAGAGGVPHRGRAVCGGPAAGRRLPARLPSGCRARAVPDGRGLWRVLAAAVLPMLLAGMLPMLDLAEIRRYLGVLRGSGWLVLGAASGEVTSRLYSFAVVGRFGTAALAELSAVQVVIRPAWMLSAAWSSIGYPQMAACRAEGMTGWAWCGRCWSARRSAPPAASYGAAMVIAAWPWISGVLYHGRYEDIGLLGYLWGANVMLGSIALALNVAMLAMGEFKPPGHGGPRAGALMGHNYTYAVVATMMGQRSSGLLQNRLRRPAVRLSVRRARDRYDGADDADRAHGAGLCCTR